MKHIKEHPYIAASALGAIGAAISTFAVGVNPMVALLGASVMTDIAFILAGAVALFAVVAAYDYVAKPLYDKFTAEKDGSPEASQGAQKRKIDNRKDALANEI